MCPNFIALNEKPDILFDNPIMMGDLSMTYWRLFYHLIWATKNRLPLIDPRFEKDLYQVITAKAGALGAHVHAIGGTENHIHLVVSIPPSISVSSFAGQVKGNAAHYINHWVRPDFEFKWQNEFGVVSFGERQLETVMNYAKHQKVHHAQAALITGLEEDQELTGSQGAA